MSDEDKSKENVEMIKEEKEEIQNEIMEWKKQAKTLKSEDVGFLFIYQFMKLINCQLSKWHKVREIIIINLGYKMWIYKKVKNY